MAKSCSDALSRIKNWAVQIVTYCNRVTNHAGDAYAHWLATQDHDAIYDLWQAVEDLNVGLSYCNGGWSPYDYEGYLWWYLSNCIEAPTYTLTMSEILKAMDKAEPHQPLLFVAYLEAYRASVWNATFDETFFADLVRKWSIWG